MYVGRIVAVGRNMAGAATALYRVSSRSFPNRHSVLLDQSVAIVPKPGHESDIQKNPYIAYNCLRLVGDYAVVTNGSHTDPLSEKLAAGLPPRDALAYVMLSMDYEHDSLNTPRIAGVVSANASRGWLGIVRKDALLVKEFDLQPGRLFYVCTYERNEPGLAQCSADFNADSASEACAHILGQGGEFTQFEKPVSAACAMLDAQGQFKVAVA
ncbi:MAG: IMP cyclohydrolase [Oligosphaeraceae bacterium]|nr:IMP cyclohydrolase [Oligosphaeraceae bacterium]